MFEYLPAELKLCHVLDVKNKTKSWRSGNKFVPLRPRVVDLKEEERYVDYIFNNVTKVSCSYADTSIAAIENESLRSQRHLLKIGGNNPLEGTSSSGDEQE